MNSRKVAAFAVLIILSSAFWLLYYYKPWGEKTKSRTQEEKQYLFKCRAGHFFEANGRKSPRSCNVEGCQEEAYIYLVFSCPNLHKIGILLKTNPDEYRFEKDTSALNWQPFDVDKFFQVPCPECYTPGLRPAPYTPG